MTTVVMKPTRRRRLIVYLQMWRSQLKDKNAGAKLPLREKLRRGRRLASQANMVMKGPPYRAPGWMKWP